MKKFIRSCAFLASCTGIILPASVVSDNTTPHGRWDVFADVLYWFASEETTSIWASVVGQVTPGTNFFEAKNLSFDWKVGGRVGFGYTRDNQWDTQLYYTRYKTHAKSCIPQVPNQIIETEFFVGFLRGDIALSGQLEWSLAYNMFDWELGRKFTFDKVLSIRPFIGLKGGWIPQKICSQWQNTVLFRSVHRAPPPSSNFTSTENLTNNFWGIGPSAGVNTVWKWLNLDTGSLSAFGDFSLATMWSSWSGIDHYTNSNGVISSLNTKRSSLGALMFRGFAGLGWDSEWGHGKYRFTTQLGYEMQQWQNQLRIPTFQELILHGDLTLQGGTFHCRFEF